MEKIDEQLKHTSLVEAPTGLHQHVMQRINYWHYLRPVLLVLLLLFLVNSIIMAWHINSKLIDAEFNDMIGDLWSGFDLSFDFLGTIIGSFFDIISPELFISLVLSVTGLIYVIKRLISLKLIKL